MRYRERLGKFESQLAELVCLLDERLERLERIVEHLIPRSPTSITFKEITMLPAVGGNTLVYTGTLSPSGAQFPAGTTFTVTSSDPTVLPTVDATGLIVTIPLPSGFVDNASNPLTITWATSTFTPSPSSNPASLTAQIQPTVPVQTPQSVSFTQTT
jgi:hypothetical protein